MNSRSADMIEVFSSIQGEGLLVGLRQAFLRFSGCNLACAYCDTREAIPGHGTECCRLEKTPGRGDFSLVKNPLSLRDIKPLLDQWLQKYPDSHHSISLTGGEPLLQVETLLEWLPVLRDLLPIYLETNGILHESLSKCINLLDFVSMDVKLPSTSGIDSLWEQHRLFLSVASSKQVYVKTVVSDRTEDWEIIKTSQIISATDGNIPLVIQPLTGKAGELSISSLKLLELQEIASGILREVRVIPQTHRFMSML
jgi:organic radical activating enzyme